MFWCDGLWELRRNWVTFTYVCWCCVIPLPSVASSAVVGSVYVGGLDVLVDECIVVELCYVVAD